MGLFDFGPKPPYHRVTIHEYRDKVVPQLHNLQFHGTDLGILEGLMEGNLQKGSAVHEGIDQKEFDTILEWLKSNRSKHTLSDHQIEQYSEIMAHYLEKSS